MREDTAGLIKAFEALGLPNDDGSYPVLQKSVVNYLPGTEGQIYPDGIGGYVLPRKGAFLLNEDMSPWTGERPKPGDRVYIEKYAGKLVKGRDGRTYRIMDYGSIGATYEADPGQKTGDK